METKGVIAASQPRWIPVTERLPEPGENVLVFDSIIGRNIDFHDGIAFGCDQITHWMPLPDPPKEVDHE